MQKVDYSKISPELRKKLEELDKKRPENQQLQVLQDIAMMFQEVIMSSDDKQKDTDKVIKDFGAVLIDARENLQKIANKEDKEFPEFPDIAKPITEVLDKLIKAVESKEYSPKIDVKVPEIKVPKSTINIDAPDLKGIERLLKTEVPKAFEEAISKIPQTEIPEYPDRWDEVLKWLEDIDTATRMKPIPGSMSINNFSDMPAVSVDTTGLATDSNQTDGSQKTQIVDAGGEVATVTGGKLDVNATASLAGDAIPATGATTAVTVQIADGSGNQITSFGGGTQYSDGDANADPIGTVAMGTDGSNVFALHTDTAGDLQVDVLTMPTTAVTGTFWQATQPVSAASLPLPTGAATAANQQTDALTDAQLRATPVPVSGTVTTSGLTDAELRATPVVVDLGANNDVTVTGTVTANLGATDNAVLDAIETDTTTIAGDTTSIDAKTPALGQALEASSVPVVLTAAQITTLTPPAAITGFATAANQLPDGHNVTVDNASIAVTGTFWQATQPVSGTVTANLSATDNAVLDQIELNQDTQTGVLTTIDADTGAMVTDLAAIEVLLTGIDADTNAIKTATQLIDNAISGSEMQVDVVAALPAGTNAIGKLAANSGVDIGDVTLNNTLGAGTSDASTVRTTESTGATGTLSNVSASASSVTVLAANTSRREAILYNDSTSDAYLKFGSTASATSFTFKWNSYDTIIVDKYNGILTAIWDSATGTARCTETT